MDRELIKRLQVQADALYAETARAPDFDENLDMLPFLEIFAHLVAEECAKLAETGVSDDAALRQREPYVDGEASGYRRSAGYIRQAFRP